KSWAVRYRVGRQSRKLTLEGFPSLAVARKLAQCALDAVSEGKDPAQAKKASRNAPSNCVDDVFAEFMAKHVRRRDGRPICESTCFETARLLGLKLDPRRTRTLAPSRPATQFKNLDAARTDSERRAQRCAESFRGRHGRILWTRQLRQRETRRS